MPRSTREQIDAEIVDTAAALFAAHGYETTSLQRVADAVGYSKTGLLHRFASKEALLTAVAELTVRGVEDVLRRVDPLPAGRDRDGAAVEALVDLAVRHTGAVSLVFALFGPLADTVDGRGLQDVPGLLLRCFATGPDAPLERRARVLGALGTIATLVPAFAADTGPGQLCPLTTAVALDALG